MGMGSEILVIKTDTLFSGKQFEGFVELKKVDYLSKILKSSEYRIRTPQLEEDPSWQQPIPYVWLVNPRAKEVFLYKRAVTGNEGRLHDKFSGGVGGHIDKDTEEHASNPIAEAMMRELREEVKMQNYPNPKIVGFINLRGGVDEVHFGIVAIAETLEVVEPAEDMASGRFYGLKEAERVLGDSANNVERWTQASWPYVRNYLLAVK